METDHLWVSLSFCLSQAVQCAALYHLYLVLVSITFMSSQSSKNDVVETGSVVWEQDTVHDTCSVCAGLM